jgi:hypothetical protein
MLFWGVKVNRALFSTVWFYYFFVIDVVNIYLGGAYERIYFIIMKKLYVLIIFLAFCGEGVFGDAGKREEIDFLLFLPNSSDQFADADQAMTRLDAAARNLRGRQILPGQIYVYGYAANVINDIEAGSLSINRALFVIQELQKRGIAGELFAEPVGYGEVDLWGSNTDEPDRIPNRRVRILVEDIILTPAISAPESAAVTPPAVIPPKKPAGESRPSFPWWLLLLALLAIAAVIFFASRRKKNAPPKPTPIYAQKAEPPEEKIIILEEEEIRLYAYGLYERRYGQDGDAAGDWLRSIRELTAHYEALGYRVILYWEQEAQQLRQNTSVL